MSGWMTCIPIVVLILGVLMTKRMTESLLVSSLIAAAMLYKTQVLTGYSELIYSALSNTSFQLIIIVAICFGGMVRIFEQSGAMLGLQKHLEIICKGPKSSLVFTWLLGGIVFIDDYLNALAVSASMKNTTDHYRIPREHLAYTVNCMGACICVMIPASSWSAFAMSCMANYDLPVETYYKAIPFMIYPICAIVICLLLACRKLPLLGNMKHAYERVECGGSVKAEGKDQEEMRLANPSSFLNFLIPMISLIVVMIGTGNDIVPGIIVAIVVLFVMLIAQRRMKVSEFVEHFLQGGAGMTPLLVNICIGFALQAANEKLGFIDFVIAMCGRSIPAFLLPVTAFLVVGILAFLAASFWTLIVLTFPIFIPLAMHMNVPAYLVIAAIMSGVALGSQSCLYSDAIFMVASATDVPNDVQFRSIMPYVAIGTIVAAVVYLIIGVGIMR